jgi:predicted site-specific integrase-resolvase
MKTSLPNYQRSTVEVADILRVSPRTVQRWVEAGELPAKDGLIEDNDLRAYLDAHTTGKE